MNEQPGPHRLGSQTTMSDEIVDTLPPALTDDLDLDETVLANIRRKSGEMYLYDRHGHPYSLRDQFAGQACFLILSGPSLHQHDLTLLNQRGVFTFAVNNAWSVVRPNAWVHVDHPSSFIDIGWKDPAIMKFSPLQHLNSRIGVKENGTFRKSKFKTQDMPNVWYFKRNTPFDPETYLTEPTVNWGNGKDERDVLGCRGGRSVMLAAVKIIYYLGFRRVFLLGADFHMSKDASRNYAFEQERNDDSIKGNNATYAKLNMRFIALRPYFERENFKVYNCNKSSHLQAFDYLPYSKAIEHATKTCSKPIDTDGWYTQNQNNIDKFKEEEKKKGCNGCRRRKIQSLPDLPH